MIKKNFTLIKQINQIKNINQIRKIHDVVVLSAGRTPVGGFLGSLASLSAVQLGSIALKSVIERADIQPNQVEEVILGNVCSAGLGQSPARQAAIGAGIPTNAEALTVNKVCSSGLKAVSLATQSIKLGDRNIIAAGGMESMSNVPLYLQRNIKYGNQKIIDGIINDGLWDPYNQIHMGNCAENSAKKFNITREMQDEFTIKSYKRAEEAFKNGKFNNEMIPIKIKDRKGNEIIINEDEEYKKINFERINKLKPVFDKNGTVTAANSSPLSDGASALILSSSKYAKELGKKPIAKILGYADAAIDPIDFPIAPAAVVPLALKNASKTLGKEINIKDISIFEFNEAFSVVILANGKLLNIPIEKVNPLGGAIALGHPIGSSGSRILTTLIHQLKPGQLGLAAICNGGGAATSVVVERL